jgi:MYXO-CTERM domain-containing protein
VLAWRESSEVLALSNKFSALLSRWFLALTCLSIALLVAPIASAAGRIEWKSKKINEKDKAWHLEVTIYMGKAPDVAHVPMKFEFLPTVYYERSMVDGDKLIDRKVPLDNRQDLIETVDVGFLDAGSGKIENRTRFTFKVTRAHGYEAGEYKITIRDARNGQIVGTPTTMSFEGENEIIDRRAMVFSGKEKEKKKKDDPGDVRKVAKDDAEKKAQSDADAENTDTQAAKSGGESAAEQPPADEAGEGDEAASDGPPEEKKAGGCGCRTTGSEQGSPAALLLGSLLILGLSLRRRSCA